MFGAWVTEVYDAARAAWDLTDVDLAEIARTGVDASFADEATKAELGRAIDDWLIAEGA
jgi:adenosine deaminase